MTLRLDHVEVVALGVWGRVARVEGEGGVGAGVRDGEGEGEGVRVGGDGVLGREVSCMFKGERRGGKAKGDVPLDLASRRRFSARRCLRPQGGRL